MEKVLPWPKIFLGVALVATVVGAIFATKTLAGVEKNIAEAKEAARPANIKLTKITASACTDCASLDSAVTALKKQNVSVEEEKAVAFDSPDGLALIQQLGITRVPTYVVTGEVSKDSLENFVRTNGEIKNNAFIFTKVPPVFIDPETKKEMGRVVATLLTDPSCSQCINPNLTIGAYKEAGIKIADTKEVVWNSAEGQRIINQYKVTKVPTFILSSDIDLYESVKANWTQIGTIEQDKTYVARNLLLPYRDLEKNQLLGLVDVIYLTDSTCSDCYRPQDVHKNILIQSFGVGIRSEQTVDTNSPYGKSLVSKYKITQVPTMLISPEVKDYIGIQQVWPQVGTTESDGWYVFRQMQQLGGVIYKDLTNNQVIRPAQPSPAANGGGQ